MIRQPCDIGLHFRLCPLPRSQEEDRPSSVPSRQSRHDLIRATPWGEAEAEDRFIPLPDGETEEREELHQDEAMSSLQS